MYIYICIQVSYSYIRLDIYIYMYSSIPIKVHHISICIQGNFSFNTCIQPTEAHHPKKFRTKPGHAQPKETCMDKVM